MRKISTLFCAVLMSLSALATDYTGNLTVSVNGEGSTQPATITIIENAGKYELSIKNFTLVSGDGSVPVGNIVLDNVSGATDGSLTTLYTNKNITITAGDAEGVAADAWMGPMLGEVPVKMASAFTTDGYLGVNIDIDMTGTLGQVIKVAFENVGNHFQMPNSDFETWSDKNKAPRHWHGFESVKGGWSFMVKSDDRLQASSLVHDKANGAHCAVVTSKKVATIVANGTITNGVLNASSISATDAGNHSETDLASTDVDANGDPFATPIYAKPDAVKFWTRFKQAKSQADYPYASFKAIITDGTYYQDPEGDTDYTNKVAVAVPDQEKMKEGDWREVVCNFNYDAYSANNAEAKAILMTFSTNATPGKGSYESENLGSIFKPNYVYHADSLFIDDVELVYAAGIKSVSFKGQTLDLTAAQTAGINLAAGEEATAADFVVEKDGQDAKVTTLVEATESGYEAVITVVSADLKTVDTCVVKLNKPATPALKGDVNGDGIVDVADVTVLIDKVLNSADTDQAADVNADGTVDVADVTALINIILG